MNGKTLSLTMLGVLVLAALGAMVSAVNVPERSFHVMRWAVAVAAASGAAMCLLVSASGAGWRRERSPRSDWGLVLSSLTLAALAPVSVSSCAHIDRADGAMFCVALAAVFLSDSRRRWSTCATSSVLVAIATMLDVTSLCLPAGILLSAVLERRRGAQAVVVATAAVAGCVVMRLIGGPMLAAVVDTTRLTALHADVKVTLPMVLLGVGGWSSLRSRYAWQREQAWVTGWSIAGCLGLLAVLAGAPLSVRLAVLPLCWWMPAGLASLAGLVRLGAGRAGLPSRVGWAVGLLLMALTVGSLQAWKEGPLLVIYLLTLEY